MAIRAAFAVGACAAVACALAGCVGVGGRPIATVTVHDNGPTGLPPIYPSSTASFPSAEHAPASTTIPGDGTYRVGIDVQPGTYQSDGSEQCYWERLKGLGGSTADIIANSDASGPQVVQIAPSDVGFKTERCGTWSLVSASAAAPTPAMPAQSPPPAAIPATSAPISLPAGAQVCPAAAGASGSFTHSAVGTSDTSCPFAEQVRIAYGASGPPASTPRQINAASPVTGQMYTLTCVPTGSLVTCTGGDDAVVYVY